MESLNDLKQSSMETKNKLSEDLERTERQNKELEYCRQIYEQELQNVKQTSANWEETLQAKLRQLQSEKEQVLQEYAEYKQHRMNNTTQSCFHKLLNMIKTKHFQRGESARRCQISLYAE
jgi:DNA anti-recombination protein RmuC